MLPLGEMVCIRTVLWLLRSAVQCEIRSGARSKGKGERGEGWASEGKGERPLALHKGREAHRLRRSVWLRLRHLLLLLYLQPVAAAHSDGAVPPREPTTAVMTYSRRRGRGAGGRALALTRRCGPGCLAAWARARRRKVRGRTWRSGHLHAMGGCRVVRRRAINPSSHRLHLEPVYAKVLRRSSRSMG